MWKTTHTHSHTDAIELHLNSFNCSVECFTIKGTHICYNATQSADFYNFDLAQNVPKVLYKCAAPHRLWYKGRLLYSNTSHV